MLLEQRKLKVQLPILLWSWIMRGIVWVCVENKNRCILGSSGCISVYKEPHMWLVILKYHVCRSGHRRWLRRKWAFHFSPLHMSESQNHLIFFDKGDFCLPMASKLEAESGGSVRDLRQIFPPDPDLGWRRTWPKRQWPKTRSEPN